MARPARSPGTRLIDRGTLRFEASAAGFAERYGRGETSHTIHVWWARRPHTAMRALAFACLCGDDSESAVRLMAEVSAPFPDARSLKRARVLARNGGKRAQRTLDMFGGGGTLPFECAVLGAEAYSVDSNELSVFLQRCLLVYAQELGIERLKPLVSTSGQRVLARLAELTTPLFPRRGTVATYFWTYTKTCTSCGYAYSLLKRPWLSRRKAKRVALIMARGEGRDEFTIRDEPDELEHPSRWIGRHGTSACPSCATEHAAMSVSECNDSLVAVSAFRSSRGKAFRLAASGDVPTAHVVAEIRDGALAFLEEALPSSLLPKWSGIVNPALYGIETHADVHNPRQQAVLLCLLQALGEEFDSLRDALGDSAAKATVGLLSALVDQAVDWNSRLSMWISQNEQAGRAFCGPGVAMMWDYAETDPMGGGPSNLAAKLDRIVAGCDALLQLPARVDVRKGYAQELPFQDAFFDAVITDPPYYDNIYYNVLADFFYAWKRLLLHRIEPSLFTAATTDCSRELVASTNRSGSKESAHRDYCGQLALAVREAERVLSPDGVFALVFSHGSLNGWEALIGAYRGADLHVDRVEPLSIERKQRPRAVISEAINTCMVFVARKRKRRRGRRSTASLLREFDDACRATVTPLKASGWTEEDAAMAGFAQGVGMLMNADGTNDGQTDRDVLRLFELRVRRTAASFKLSGRGSL